MTYYWTSTQGAWGSTTVVTYPCDRGMGRGGVTYHDFTANAAGVAVCRFCGARPGGKSRRRKFPRPRT